MNILLAFSIFFGLVFVIAISGGVLVYVSIKKKWNLKLAASLVISFSILIITIIFWLSLREIWIFWGGLTLSVIQGVVIYIRFPGQLRERGAIQCRNKKTSQPIEKPTCPPLTWGYFHCTTVKGIAH
jgi:predicted membrane channel-forming protein YqfA (hemolysin III family)